jgi:hypothetical protein
MTKIKKLELSSFRDPTGRVLVNNNRVYRIIYNQYKLATLDFLDSYFFKSNCYKRKLPLTKVLTAEESQVINQDECELILEHQPIPFPIYPHECTPGMLFDGGQFTIDLAEDALKNELILKDATPWNVLFSEGRPVFCDILSFEPWSGSKIWNAYAQFQRTFILPLYAHQRLAWPIHSIFVTERDGLDPSILSYVIRGWRRWLPFEMQAIIFPAKLSQKPIGIVEKLKTYTPESGNRQLANFVLRRSFNRLRKQLESVRPQGKFRTQWSSYENDIDHYSTDEHQQKLDFVRDCLLRSGRGRVLDIGANSGEYSILAASQGNPVIAADFDVAALDKLYARIKLESLPITPVVFNIARPTPSVGWNNSEVDSFLSRAKGQFNVLMVLALLHHLLVTERIPLEYIINLLYDFQAPFLIIEWVSHDDQRFKQISNTHGDLYSHLTIEYFKLSLEKHFVILEQLQLAAKTRTLFLCQRR